MLRSPYRWPIAARPYVRWGSTLVLAGAAAFGVAHAQQSAEQARDRWGRARQVLVTTRPVAAGEALDAGNSSLRLVPEALLGDDPVARRPVVAIATVALGADEIVRTGRIGRGDRSAIAALVPTGRSAVAVPRGDDKVPLVVGDRVGIIAVATDRPGAPPEQVASGAIVVHVTDQAALVAVTDAELGGVATALADGVAVLSLSG